MEAYQLKGAYMKKRLQSGEVIIVSVLQWALICALLWLLAQDPGNVELWDELLRILLSLPQVGGL